jgi:hypothetical protein
MLSGSSMTCAPARRALMSVPELKALARKHWTKYRPKMVRDLKARGELDQALQGAATLAQEEINRLMGMGYYEHEAREVALPAFVLLPEEKVDDEQARELAEMEANYLKNPPPNLTE